MKTGSVTMRIVGLFDARGSGAQTPADEKLIVLGLAVFCLLASTHLLPAQAPLPDVLAGPVVNRANGHAYYLLSQATWTDSEAKAVELGGHLATINNQVEQDWAFGQFGFFGAVSRHLWIGFRSTTTPTPDSAYSWVSVEPTTYTHWADPEPNDPLELLGREKYVIMYFPTHPWYAGKWANASDDYPASGVVEIQPPVIITSPQSQPANLGDVVTFTVTVVGVGPFTYQWRKEGVNIPGAVSPSLTLANALPADDGGYSVLVWNAYGSVASDTAYLAVLGVDMSSPPAQVSSAPSPPKIPSLDSLVVVTHGYAPLGGWEDESWVVAMAAAIEGRVPNNWLVQSYLWSETAWGLPSTALIIARIQGGVYGGMIAAQHWRHVHLIGHSAGSAFVEAVAKKIKALSPDTTVHCTFLDPFLSDLLVGVDIYGANADWADCYFAQDWTGAPTDAHLKNAYSVDVTWADSQRRLVTKYCPVDDWGITLVPCDQVATSSHGWPVNYYLRSIVGGNLECAAGTGFAFSKEAGGWENRPSYKPEPPPLCGTTSVAQGPVPPLETVAQLALDVLPTASSPQGVQFLGNCGLMLNSALPQVGTGGAGNGPVIASSLKSFGRTPAEAVWLTLGWTVTNPISFVQLDSMFVDTNSAEGLLTVYWNTNWIGMLDERVSSPGLQTYRFGLPDAATSGVFALSFRLDSFSNGQSSIIVTNVIVGRSGRTAPAQLDLTLTATNDNPILGLRGTAGVSYVVQSSTDLLDWTPTALLAMTNEMVLFVETNSTISRQRFYRAVAPW